MDEQTMLREIAGALQCDAQRADGLALVVMDELRQRLTPAESADVAAQLPERLKREWLEQERPGRPVQKTHAPELIVRVRKRCSLPDDAEAERAVLAVFRALQHALGSPSGKEGEAWDVFSQLPKDLKLLWLKAAEPAHRPPDGVPSGRQEVRMSTEKSEYEKLLDELATQRDELRVRMHLAKNEAKDEWERLEHKWTELRSKAKVVGREAERTAGEVGAALRLAAQELKRGYERVRHLI